MVTPGYNCTILVHKPYKNVALLGVQGEQLFILNISPTKFNDVSMKTMYFDFTFIMCV